MSEIRIPHPPRGRPLAELEQLLEHPEAVVQLRDGRTLTGTLERFRPQDPDITLHSDQGPHQIPLAKVRSLHLAESLPFVLDTTPFEDDPATTLEVPSPRQEFVLKFKDGEIMEGETFGYTTDHRGLHLFICQPFDKYRYQFVPFRALRDYRIGPLLGEILIKKQAISPEQMEAVLEEQEQLRNQRIGDYLTANAIVSLEDLNRALERQQRTPNLRLGEALVQEGLISEEQLQEALKQQKQDRSKPLGEILVERGLVDGQLIRRTLAKKLGIPYVQLRKLNIDPAVTQLVPEALARRHHLMPVTEHQGKLVVVVDDPMNRTPLEELRFHTKRFVEPVMADSEDIQWAINHYYGGQLDELAEEALEDEPSELSRPIEESDNALVRLVNKIIIDAYQAGASDIHIEPSPGRGKVRVRIRVDGILRDYTELPHSYRHALVSRIKIMCDLDISERRKPQDGKIDFKRYAPLDIELRVATLPTAGGTEDVVMRILAHGEPIPMDRLGLVPHTLERVREQIEKPYGLFLVCGPTGSGKTTTLHSLLAHINTPERKIWTAEDPVEITQAGLRQVQVNPKIGLTFAQAMRAFLRADPDVIMVGEMRDEETTAIGIEASLTGHLVFSTLHTNSAPESVVRLLDMGMDPFNFADALLGILAQRLARTLCDKCKQAYPATDEELDELAREYFAEHGRQEDAARRQLLIKKWRQRHGDKEGRLTLYRAQGCEECGNSGYRGRIGLHEFMAGSDEIKHLIQEKAPVTALFQAAARDGMSTLKQDGIDKVLQGHTDIHQVRAVCVK